MIRFIFKGIIRDRSRSLFPILTVLIGVTITVFVYSWITGAKANFIESSAKFSSGHLKIMSRAYAENVDQVPNDLAYIGIEVLIENLKDSFPDLIWTPRIRFGGLLDIPDERGETRAQGPAAGLAVDLFSDDTAERDILNLENALVRGRLPQKQGEVLVSEDFARKLELRLDETATLISSTMYGSTATANFSVVGTVRFGMAVLDRGSILADIRDIQDVLAMQDAAGEILGLFNDMVYRENRAEEIAVEFNTRYSAHEDEFLPVMETLYSQGGLMDFIPMFKTFTGAILGIFMGAMSIVLWNAGLMGNLRRYGEIGVRLAMGESKGHLYRSMLIESFIIGCVGSALGTILGLGFAYYLQAHGLDYGALMRNSSVLISNVMRTKVTPVCYGIGFIPGLGATFLGAAISGIGIYRRQTARLMKELEV